jgi:hypothetical protein
MWNNAEMQSSVCEGMNLPQRNSNKAQGSNPRHTHQHPSPPGQALSLHHRFVNDHMIMAIDPTSSTKTIWQQSHTESLFMD